MEYRSGVDCVCNGTEVEGNGADCAGARPGPGPRFVGPGPRVKGNDADCAGTGVEGSLAELFGIETGAGTALCGTDEELID